MKANKGQQSPKLQNSLITSIFNVKSSIDKTSLFSITLTFIDHFTLNIDDIKESTPFENAQRWMGKNTFQILLLNDDNMIGEH